MKDNRKNKMYMVQPGSAPEEDMRTDFQIIVETKHLFCITLCSSGISNVLPAVNSHVSSRK